MADPAAQQRAPEPVDDLANQPAVAAPEAGGTAAIRALLARSASVDDVAAMLCAHPQQRHAAIAMLQRERGNAYVQQVLAVVAADRTPPTATAAAADTAPAPTPAATPSSAMTPLNVRVTADGLNVRSSPDKTSTTNIVGGLHHHQSAVATSRDGEWFVIMHAGQPAYINSGFVEVVEAPPAVATQPAAAPASTPAAVAVVAPAVAEAHVAKTEPPAAAPSHADPGNELAHQTTEDVKHATAEAKHAEHAEHETTAPAVAAQPAPPAPEHVQAAQVAIAAEHKPTASAETTPAPASQPDPAHVAQLQAEYRKLLRLFAQEKLTQTQAVSELIALDEKLNHGQLSVDGTTLVAALIGEMLPIELKRTAKLETRPAATEAPTVAAATPATTPAAPEKPLPHVKLGQGEQQLVDDLRALKTPESELTATLLENVDTRVSLLSKNMNEFEYQTHGREELVGKIGELRHAIGALDVPGLDKAELAALRARVYRHIQDVSPYFSQYRNVDILEQFHGDSNTRTCNVTSLSMALESLGATPGSYDGAYMKIAERVAGYFMNETQRAAATGEAAGTGKLLDKAELKVGTGLDGLRMPDFVELAAVAEYCTADADDKAINAARWKAWPRVLEWDFLQILAGRFHVPTTVAALKDGGGKSVGSSLAKWGGQKTGRTGKGTGLDSQRMDVEHLVDARNDVERLEAHGKQGTKEYDKAKAKYDAMESTESDALEGTANGGAPIELEDYKKSVLGQIGVPFDAGKAIVIGLSGHFTRLMGIEEDGLIIGDPAMWTTGSHRKVLWAEARAMGYFNHFMVMG